MRPETVDLLCNPYKGEPFKLEGDHLVGVSSGQRFPIRDGIPVILNKSQVDERNRRFRFFHDLGAPLYDTIVNLGSSLGINSEYTVRSTFISELPIQPGDRVLETAIGTASNLLYLPDHGSYFGLDISFEMLKRARKKMIAAGREVEVVQADGAYIPFRDNTFNLVFQMGGLQFFANPFKAVSEMARVALPGTAVYIIDEISGALRTLGRMPAYKQYSATRSSALDGIQRLIPHSMLEVNSSMIPGTDFYALTFQKP